MVGDDRGGGSCEECGLSVYNLSAMTTAEASAFVAGSGGRTSRTISTGGPTGRSSRLIARSGPGPRGMVGLRKIAGLGVVGLAMSSTAVAALGFGRFAADPPSSGFSTKLDEWARLGP